MGDSKEQQVRGLADVERLVRRAASAKPSVPATTDKRITDAALELLRRDAELDDDKFTPPGAISLCIDARGPNEASDVSGSAR